MQAMTRIGEGVPFNPDVEQMVLGAMMMRPERCAMVLAAGGADLFHDPLHGAICDVILAKDKAGDLVSPVTVAEVMRSRDMSGVGGVGYIARLAAMNGASAADRGYVAMLADLRRKRSIAAAITDATAAMARGEDSADIIAGRLEAALVASEGQTGGRGPMSMLAAVTLAMKQTLAAYQGEESAVVKTGIRALDAIISGLYPGELVLLGGRPSMGKTATALAIALNAARAGHGVCIASLEMNPEAMALRALAEATSHASNAVYYDRMRRGDMTEPQMLTLVECAQHVAQLPITFLSREHADIGALIAGAKQAHRSMAGGMRLLIVDYAQRLRAPGKGRYEQVTEISIALKMLSGQLNVPVLALSQLSRQVESRDDKRPMLSDLRESGQLEQDADSVLFCYRDEYYLEREKPQKAEAIEAWQASLDRARNRMEIIVAKQRQGEVRTAHVRFAAGTNMIWEDGR